MKLSIWGFKFDGVDGYALCGESDTPEFWRRAKKPFAVCFGFLVYEPKFEPT